MWVFTKIGFFSAVEHRTRPDSVMVRSRSRRDLDQLLKMLQNECAVVMHTPKADYPYRVILRKSVWAEMLGALSRSIDYENFKSEVARSDRTRAKVYSEIWSVGLEMK